MHSYLRHKVVSISLVNNKAISNELKSILKTTLKESFSKFASRDGVYKYKDFLKLIGRGSFSHMNFRFILAPRIVQLLITRLAIPIERAWIYDLDVTESEPEASDVCGDDSPCDSSKGSNLKLVFLLTKDNKRHLHSFNRVNELLVGLLKELNVRVDERYLEFSTLSKAELSSKRHMVNSHFYPTTELSLITN